MYRADSIDVMSYALRWYVATSGCWAIAAVCFIASYAPAGRIGKYVATLIVAAFVTAMVVNGFSPASFLYTELTGLREITLPWGERIWLAIGEDNPWRLVFELAMLAILGLVAVGCYQFWLRKERRRAVIFGSAVLVFMLCFGTHAFLVDTGRLDSPYLSTYGFLALVGLTSYDLAGEVIRTGELRSKLAQRESDLRTAVADERNRIAGELHDSVTQTLFSTAAIADALPEVWRRRPEEAANDLFVDSFDSAVELTDREREVLALLVKGMSNKEIAKQLHRSPFTVRHHVSQLIKRLGAANRAEVAAIAMQRGLTQ